MPTGFHVVLGHGYSINVIHRADYMQGTRMSFKSKEDAIHFAEKQGVLSLLSPTRAVTIRLQPTIHCSPGWDYYLQPPTVKKIPPKNYSENFLYRPNKLRIARTK